MLVPILALGALGARIRKDLVQIDNDIIKVVEASTSIDSSTGKIAHLTSSPAGSMVGTRGIVYTLPDLPHCLPIKRSQKELAESYIRIALIPDDDDCPVKSKLLQAQYDGAVGAIIYNTSQSALEMSATLHTQLGKYKPNMPVMAVDREYGETLRAEVATLLDEAWTSSSDRFRAIFASIFPDEDSEQMSVWEITLISLVVLLALGFCISLFFHISPRHRRYLDRTLRDDNGSSSKKIETLPSCALDRLILRTVTEADVAYLSACKTPLDAILRSGSQDKTTHSQCSHNDASVNTMSTLENGADPLDSGLKGTIATCIVCIDDFVVGSKMRILPCGHNFHIECIDPWLTSKSSLCPLCKFDTRSVLTDLERSLSGPQILADMNGFEESIYSLASSEPSSYLAESRPHLPVVDAIKDGTLRMVRQIAAPMRALGAAKSKCTRRQSHTIAADGSIAMHSTSMVQIAPTLNRLPFESSKPNNAPTMYTLSIDEASSPASAFVQMNPSLHAGDSSHTAVLTQETAELQGMARGGQGAPQVPEIALRSSDSLSDTKIFVLLAAIVFVFLLALGVAMTRVSRGRRRQRGDHIEHHIAAASAPPATLNKTILDMLPVFEVTPKRQLRQLQISSPQALNDCFGDETSTYSSPPVAFRALPGSCETTSYAAKNAGGYDLDSGKASLCSAADGAGGQSYGSETSILASNQGATELQVWCSTKKRIPSHDINLPAPAAFRFYANSSRSATPASARHLVVGERWYTTPDTSRGSTADANAGTVMYRARSTQSLDMTPERDTPERPAAAWAGGYSQPEIARHASAESDGGLGACPICLEEFEAGEHLRELPCMHRYHLMCIDTWLVSRSTSCPYCKLDIRRWYYGSDFEDTIPHVGPAAPPLIGRIPDAAPRTLRRIERPAATHRLARAARRVLNALG
ncbi:hypothetical protein LPJ78_003367 [Coemansia sp. RSA 989]|nr:hypothetical protein LPJ78_003367 [Coemansia sp. RSA 989]